MFASTDTTIYYPGLNDIVIDAHNRIFGSVAERKFIKIGDDPRTPNVILMENPFLQEVVTIDGKTYDPFHFTASESIGVDAGLCPSSLHIDKQGYLYIGQNVKWDYRGGIKIYKDCSWSSNSSAGGYQLNQSNFNYAKDVSGFRQIGVVLEKYPPPEYELIRPRSMAVDYAGNIWCLRFSITHPDFDVFGLTGKTPDTLIFDKSEIKRHIVDPRWLAGEKEIPECRRGIDAYLATKTMSKIKADNYGNIWIGTSAGLFYYSEGQDSTINHISYGNVFGFWRYFLPDVGINDFDFDSLNNVWIATSTIGLKMLHYSTAKYPTLDIKQGTGDPSKVVYTSYSSSNGLISNKVLSVAVNGNTGKVFIGFDNGMQMFESGVRSATNVAKGYAYPVLVRGNEGVLLNTMQNGSSIAVFTLSGKLIMSKTLPSHQSSYKWDTRNPISNKLISTGIYLYRYTSPANTTKSGKFAVIR